MLRKFIFLLFQFWCVKYAAEISRLAANLKRLRKVKNLSQDALAMDAEISRRTLQRIESGNYDIPYTTIVALADALEVSVSDLVS